MENTPNNSNKEKTEGIAKLFLPYERGEFDAIITCRLQLNLDRVI